MKCLGVFLFALSFGAVFEGQNFPDTMSVDGKILKYNGAAKRVKFVFDVYLGALYLENPTQLGNEVISSNQLKRVEMKFLRDVKKSDLSERMEEVFKKYKNEQSKESDLQKLISYFQDMKEGESIVYLFNSSGLKLKVAGQDKELIAGRNFSEILLKGWFADDAEFPKVRDGLLGKLKKDNS